MDCVIEAQLEPRTGDELAGAYRALCGAMLLYTAFALRRKTVARNDDAYQKLAAKRWIADASGTLTFPECCAALDLNADRARAALAACASGAASPPINRGK